MKYESKKEKELVGEAIKNDTFRIDYAYETIYEYSEEQNGYLKIYDFFCLGVSKSNTEKFIIRSVYRVRENLREPGPRYDYTTQSWT